MPLIFDSGIASGTDILRAFALGAEFTFVGRRAPLTVSRPSGSVAWRMCSYMLRASLEPTVWDDGNRACPEVSPDFAAAAKAAGEPSCPHPRARR